MTFDDLDFEPRGFGKVQAVAWFPNGYSASVICGPGAYGGLDGLYELAVCTGKGKSWSLCYDTPITSDVEGYLTPEDVTRLLGEIAALPVRETAQ